MSEVVGAYAVGAFTEPQDGESPIGADAVRLNDNTVRTGFNDHDAEPGVHFQGSTLAARPAAGSSGRKWFASDTKQVFRDNGTAWDEVDYLNKTNGGTVAGNTTFTGTVTSTSGSRSFGATTFTGAITGTSASFSSSISSAGATFSAAISGTSASFSSTISAVGATFTGAVSGTSATFSSTLGVTGAVTHSSTLLQTGVATFTAQPIFSSLTASQAVFTDGSKGLVSNAITGSGNVVMSASPTFTGTITAAIANFSGALGVSGAVTTLSYTDSAGTLFKSTHATHQSIEFYVNTSTRFGLIGTGDSLLGDGTTDFGLWAAVGKSVKIAANGALVGTFSSTGLAMNTLALSGVTTLTTTYGGYGTANSYGGVIALNDFKANDTGKFAAAVFNGSATGWGLKIRAAGSSSDYALYVSRYDDGADFLTVKGNGAVAMPHYGAGTATFDAGGNITSVSDETHKRDIRDWTRGMADLRGMRTVIHRFAKHTELDQDNDYVGFLAQDVRKHIPEAVFVKKGKGALRGSLSLWDRGILATHTNALQEIDARLTKLERKAA